MTTYTYAQLEQLWINAGGPPAQAPVAAAIAEAESRGNSAAINAADNNGTQTSWGLWQVSNGTHAQPVPNILDPAVNAQQAVAKYKGAGNAFTPWGTYTSGAYKAFASGSTTPDPNVPAGTAAATLTAAQQAGASTCLIGFNSPSVLGLGGGTVCIISKAQMRVLAGGLLILAGGSLCALGAVLIVGTGLGSSRARAAGAPLRRAGVPV